MTTKSKLFWGGLSFIAGSIAVYFFLNGDIFNLNWQKHLLIFGVSTLLFYSISTYIFLIAPTKKNELVKKENIEESKEKIEDLDSKPSPLKLMNANQNTRRPIYEYPKDVNPAWIIFKFLLSAFVIFVIVIIAIIFKN